MNKMLFVHSRSLGYTFDFFNDANSGVLPRQSVHTGTSNGKNAYHTSTTSTSAKSSQDSTIGGTTVADNTMPSLLHDNRHAAATSSSSHSHSGSKKASHQSSKARRSTATATHETI
jgi:hypothetical protein